MQDRRASPPIEYDKFADMAVNATKNLHRGTVNAEGQVIAAQSTVVPTVGPLIQGLFAFNGCLCHFLLFLLCA